MTARNMVISKMIAPTARRMEQQAPPPLTIAGLTDPDLDPHHAPSVGPDLESAPIVDALVLAPAPGLMIGRPSAAATADARHRTARARSQVNEAAAAVHPPAPHTLPRPLMMTQKPLL